MSLKIRKIDIHKPDPAVIDEAAEIIKSDGVVVAPTETRYGLLARADHPVAVKRVFTIKGRDKTSPVSVFVKNHDHIGEFAEENDISRNLKLKLLPGPLTLVLRARDEILPQVVSDGRIGIRLSSSPVIARLMRQMDCCMTATSANRSGSAELDTIEEIADVFGDKVDMYLDAGRLDRSSSTVVDCSGGGYKILRVGNVPESAIENAVMEN